MTRVPKKIKGTGYYTPMDLVPDEFKSSYQTVKEQLERLMVEDWGERCKTKDTDDFADLADDPLNWGSRCPVCFAYEKLDELFEMLEPDDVEMS